MTVSMVNGFGYAGAASNSAVSNPFGMEEIFSSGGFTFSPTAWNNTVPTHNVFDPIVIPDEYHVDGALIYLECGLYVGANASFNGTYGISLTDQGQNTTPFTALSASINASAPVYHRFSLMLNVISRSNIYGYCLYGEGSSTATPLIRQVLNSPSFRFTNGNLLLGMIRRTGSVTGQLNSLKRTHVFCGVQLP